MLSGLEDGNTTKEAADVAVCGFLSEGETPASL